LIYVNTSTSTYSDIIYQTEGSSNNASDKDARDKNDDDASDKDARDKNDDDASDKNDDDPMEESFEIEEEIQDINRLLEISKKAMILNEKLPDDQKNKNSHLNDLRKDPHVQEFFEGETPNVSDLPQLNKALKEARDEKINELSEAEKYANDESATNSLRDQSSSSFRESNNTFNKEDSHKDSDYKLGNSLLDSFIEFLINLF
jgi:hypothetical protein